MWYGFIVIGLVALFLNLLEAADLLYGRYKKLPYKNAFVYWIVALSCIQGLLVILPVAILFDKVPCGNCGTELCFGESALCQLNKISVFILHAILFCTLWGMLHTLQDLLGPLRGRSRASEARILHGFLPISLPCAFCLTAFLLEKTDEQLSQEELDFYMARAGFSCYMRLEVWQEIVLVQLPFVLGGFIIFCLVSATLWKLVGIVTASAQGASRRELSQSRRQKLKKLRSLQPIFLLCANMLVTLGLWVAISIISFPEFQRFVDDVEKWYDCSIFDYAQSLLYGEEWSAIRSVDCGLFPENRPSLLAQHLRYIAEAYIPLTVALSFGGLKRAVIVHEWLFGKAVSTVEHEISELSHWRSQNATKSSTGRRGSWVPGFKKTFSENSKGSEDVKSSEDVTSASTTEGSNEPSRKKRQSSVEKIVRAFRRSWGYDCDATATVEV